MQICDFLHPKLLEGGFPQRCGEQALVQQAPEIEALVEQAPGNQALVEQAPASLKLRALVQQAPEAQALVEQAPERSAYIRRFHGQNSFYILKPVSFLIFF